MLKRSGVGGAEHGQDNTDTAVWGGHPVGTAGCNHTAIVGGAEPSEWRNFQLATLAWQKPDGMALAASVAQLLFGSQEAKKGERGVEEEITEQRAVKTEEVPGCGGAGL